MIYEYMDSPFPILISEIEKANPSRFKISLSSSYPENEINEKTIEIHIVDPAIKLSVWETTCSNGEKKYNLYVPKEYSKHLPLVVNHSSSKQLEFKFDTIDIKSLIE
ncbi:MAG: hypothetical protein ACK4K0_03450 [Flavobacteriales bacterium]